MKANERQVGGDHYKGDGAHEEHWDRVARLGLDYFQGQITKYVERWKLKNGVQDLEKARHFLDKYIELQKPAPAPATEEAVGWEPHSTNQFTYEGGMRGNGKFIDSYTCRRCHTSINVPATTHPMTGHPVCPAEPQAHGYVDQG